MDTSIFWYTVYYDYTMNYTFISSTIMDVTKAYLSETAVVFSNLQTSDAWLSKEQREKNLILYGNNVLKNIHKQSLLFKFFEQFKDLMIILLLVSSFLAFLLNDIRTCVILLIIVLVNAAIGFYQEAKAEHELDSLKKLVSATAKVKIDGVLTEVASNSLVPGDIVFVESGDAVPADLRIFQESNLQTNDFSLTWESNPKRKHAHVITEETELGDRTNCLFMGTTVAVGRGRGIVIWTGMDTEIGKIASMSTEAKQWLSPMQIEMGDIAKRLSLWTIVLTIILVGITLLLDFSLKEALLFGLGIAASMVPQWLPSQVSIALTTAALSLAKRNALVKKLSSVETLGAVEIICTDKTGTLTKNEMTVTSCLFWNTVYSVWGTGYENNGTIMNNEEIIMKNITSDWSLKDSLQNIFFSTGILASNARIHAPDDHHATWYVIWDPTEGALITLANKYGFTQDTMDKEYVLKREFSFDSGRKRMSCIRQTPDGRFLLYMKWSLQTMIDKATHYFDGNEIRSITEEDHELLTKQDDERAAQAMRNLCYAYKDVSDLCIWFTENDRDALTIDAMEKNFTILGLVSMIDPPREEVTAAIEKAYAGNIAVFVITWDYALTAKSIAHRINLSNNAEKKITVIEWKELRELSDVILLQKLASGDAMIFSRVSPEDKVRIVQLCKRMGKIVAVTGDGVNDAPALKHADVGVAMGKTGTDVSKDAAEIILLDDSFASLVVAIEKGRVIYQNIKKITLSCITTNLTELTIVLLSLLLWALFDRPLALLAVQILAIDLMGEMFPLAALAWDPPMSDVLSNKPRNTKDHILDMRGIKDVLVSWLVMWLLAYAAFFIYFLIHNLAIWTEAYLWSARSVVYIAVVLSQYLNILSRRSGTMPFFTSYLWSNKKLLWAFGLWLVLISLFVYLPIANHYFWTGAMQFGDRLLSISVAIIYLFYRELYRKRRPTHY